MDLILVALSGIFLFLPALVPNSAAVLFGGGTPVDFGRTWRGKRILGDGKTWTGLIGGVAAGTSLGIILVLITMGLDVQAPLNWGEGLEALGVVFALSLGSLLGDMVGAFIKRRLGMERGHKAPILDQYDFVAGALGLTALLFPAWVASRYVSGESIIALIALLVFVPVLHRVVNIIGFKMGKKKEPW
ncbi:MAG: CDP-2,3-bis-(O-geranylgeranyl)-sn-glycerol synthase [Methanomassiliicoccus sp.]|nr:CDP-2,3-bis-(O-geranylgeranyl)-sn-glycerol synthase [Methanomassiliicoccus sp.]